MKIQRNVESVTVVSEGGSQVTFCARCIQVSTSHYSGSTPVWAYSVDYPLILAAVVAGADIHPLLDCVIEMEMPGRLLRNLCASLAEQLADAK